MYKSKIFGDLNIPNMFRKKVKLFKYVPTGMNSSVGTGSGSYFASCSTTAMSSATKSYTYTTKRKIIEDPSEGSPDGVWLDKADLDRMSETIVENEYLKSRLAELGEDEI